MKNTSVRLVRFALSVGLGLAVAAFVLWAAASESPAMAAASAPAGSTFAPSATVITHSGNIASSQVWTATTHVVSSTIEIVSNAVLTIEAGALVKFAGTGFRALILSNGKLVAVGTAAQPITFTSSAAVPHAGDWGRVEIRSGLATFAHVRIEYGTRGIHASGGQVDVTSAQIANNSQFGVCVLGTSRVNISASTISGNSEDGVNAYIGNVSAALVISATTLRQNKGHGVNFSLGSPYNPLLVDNQYLTNTGAAILVNYVGSYGWPVVTGSLPLTQALRGNALDLGIAVQGTWKPAGSVMDWDEDPRFERVIWGGGLTVDAGYTLRVPPGGVVKFKSANIGYPTAGGRLIVNGVLDAVGTPAQPITFTSLQDNSAGRPVGSGDVRTGRWSAISIGGQAVIQHAVVRYGGSGDRALDVQGGHLRLSYSRVYSNGTTASSAYGLGTTSSSQAVFVTGTQFYSNTRGGVYLVGGASTQAYISASQVVSNSRVGIQVEPNGALFQPVLRDVQLSYNAGPGLWVSYSNGWGLPFISGTTAITRNTVLNDALALSGPLGPSGVQWTLPHRSDLDYVVWADFTVGAGFTLTLPPGMLLKARNVVGVGGMLLADAAGSQPITLTSYHDNSVGRPLGSGSPARGDWPGIQVSDNGRAALSNITLRYATNGLTLNSSGDVFLNDSRLADNSMIGIRVVKGRLAMSNTQLANNTYQGLLVTGGQVSVKQSEVMASGTGIQGSGAPLTLDVDSCTIRNNTADGVYASLSSSAFFTLSNNLVQDNGGAGLKMEPLCMGCVPVLSQNNYLNNTGPALLVAYPTQANTGSNLPAITDLSASGNGLDRGVAVQGTLRNDAPISLQLDPAVGDIVVWDSLSVDGNTTVTVQPGTVLKLKPNKFLLVKGNATVIFDGTASRPITVTSIDDNSAGQPNGDGVVLQADRWAALEIDGAGTRMVLRSTWVRYGAGNTGGMVGAMGGGHIEIQSSQLSHSYRSGLQVSRYGFATLTDTQVFSNAYYSPVPSMGGIRVNDGTLVLNSSAPVDFGSPSSVYDNAQFGIYGSGVVTLTLDRAVVRNNGQHGVYVPASGGQLSIESSAILTNAGTGLYVRGIATPTVHWTDFVGNVYGVNGDSATCVDALYNWWGDILGPHDPLRSGCDVIRNYNLTGQWVNDYVSYRPWLTESARVRGLSLSPDRQAVLVPGVTSVLTHTLINTGNSKDAFVLTYTASLAPDWVAGLAPTLVTLLPGAQATVSVTLNVPAGVLSGTHNTILVMANSVWGGEAVTATVTDTLVAGMSAAASLIPTGALSGVGMPAQTVLYTFAITNQSNYAESYNPFGSTPHLWLISSTVGSAQIGVGHSAPITFGVRVPANTLSGTVEVASLSVRSVPADQVVAGAFVTTTVPHHPGVDLYPDYNKVIKLGQTYTHVHHLVNAGNYTDSYTLTASSTLSATHWGFWPTSATLAGGAQALVYLTMTMPASAALDDIHSSVLTATSWISPALRAANTDRARAGDYFSVTLSSAVAAEPPGDLHVFELDLFNAGNDFDTFTITTDAPPWFVGYSPASAGLGMEVGAPVYVTMQVPTHAISGTNSTVAIVATSGQSPTVYATATATLYARHVVSFALDGGQAAFAAPQTSVSFTHVLTNDGNYTDTFDVLGQSLHAWPVSGDSLTLGPYTSGAFTVTVSVPVDAVSSTMNVITFTANSQASPAVDRLVVDRVTATRLISLSLSPGGQHLVLPGDTFDILHSLTNNGNYTEEFTLDVHWQMNGWSVVGPPSPIQLGPRQTGEVMFSVQPPFGSGGVTNTFTLTVASGANPLVKAAAVDQVVVVHYPGIEISPGESRQVTPGEQLTFVHVLTNTGTGADSFEIAVSSASEWPVTFTPPSPIPIAYGYTETLFVSITVPLTAPAAYTEALMIRAASIANPLAQDVDGDEMVVQFAARLALSPGHSRTVDPGTVLSYTHVLTNLGNGTDVFAVTATSSRGWLTPETQNTSITLTQGQTATLVVTLAVPAGSGGLEDTLAVTATSQANPAVWTSAVNTTMVTHVPGVALSPGQTATGLPGETLSYVHAVTNTGNGPDSFAVVALSSHGWQVDCAPAVPFALGVGETTWVTVSVALPVGSGGLVDTVVVTVSSQADSTVSSTALDTSTAIQVAGVALSPGQSAAGQPGETLSYVHVVTNTGAGADSFVLTAFSSQFWLSDYAPLGPFALGAGETAVVAVTLTVPPDAAGAVDTTWLTVTSQADSAVYARVSDTTTVTPEPGVALSPGQARQVDPGESVVYTHGVTNVGSGPDSFTITVSSSQDWLVPGVRSVTLAAGQASAVPVTLTVPPDAGGLVDVTTVTATSQANPAVWASATDTTSVVYTGGVALTPSYTETLGADTTLVYTHWLTNTGNGADEFTLSLSSSRGWAELVEGSGPFGLAAGAGMVVRVEVTTPPGSEGQQEVSVLTARGAQSGVSAAVTDTTDVACVDVSGVDLSYYPANPAPGEAITFTASLAEGSQPAYTWDLGDGRPAQVGNPILYAYLLSGTYTVTLTVTNPCPSSAAASRWITLTGPDFTPEYGLAFGPDGARTVGDGEVTTYTHWLTNTGNVADNYVVNASSSQGWTEVVDAPLSLLPGRSGMVRVRLTAPAGAGGLVDVTTVTATSQANPAVWASATDTTSVIYTGGVALTPDRWGVLGASQSVIYTHWLTNTGNGADEFTLSLSSSRGWAELVEGSGPFGLAAGAGMVVRVEVTTPPGSEGQQEVSVLTARGAQAGVSAAVTDTTDVACVDVSGVDLSYSPAEPAPGEAITFTASLAEGSQPAYTWDLGDGRLAQVGNPILYAYLLSGTYTVTLTVTNPCPSSAAASRWITLTGPDFTPEYGLAFGPDGARTVGDGEVMTYTHWLTNTGNVADNYVVSASSSQGWAEVLEEQVSLLPGRSRAVRVRLTVPLGAGGWMDVTTVTARSQVNPATWGVLTDTTTVVSTSGVVLSPGQVRQVDPGESVVYTHWVTNVGIGPDSFTIEASSSQGWPTPGVQSVTLAAGQAAPVLITLTVPAGAGGLVDTLTVTATSQANPAVWASVVNTADVSYDPGLAFAPDRFGALDAGQSVIYTHWLTNTGNGADEFSLSLSSSRGWSTLIDGPGPFELAAGASQAVQVQVTAPAGSETLQDVTAVTALAQRGGVSAAVTDTTDVACVDVSGVDFSFAPPTGETGETVWFTASLASGSQPLYTWNFGDGGLLQVGNPILYAYTGSGDYTVILTVTNLCPSSASASHAISVVGNAVTPMYRVRFLPDSGSQSVDPGTVVTYEHLLRNTGNVADNYILQLSSSQGWASLEAPTVVSLLPLESRLVQVRVTVPAGAGGLQDTARVTATSQTQPSTSFASALDTTSVTCTSVSGVDLSYEPAEPTTGQAITFTGSVLQGSPPFAYTWNFGDGAPAQVGNPILHGYTTAGVYPVTVTVSNLCPSSGSASRAVTVTGNVVKPVYRVELGPDDSQTLDPGSIWVYVHTLTNTGNIADSYVVSLSSTRGWSRVTSASSVSLPPGATTPVRVRVIVPAGTEGGLSDTTTVTVTSQNDPTVQVSQVDVTTVRLSGGASLSPDRSLTVQAGSQAVYTHSLVNDYNAAQSFALAHVSSQGYVVTLDPPTVASLAANGGTATITVTVNVPANALSGTVDNTRVTAVGSLAGQLAVTDTTTVSVAGTSPVAVFVPSSSNVVVGQVVSFTNDTVGTEPISYAWTFGDGEASTLENPTHGYAAAGVYTVILTATNDYGEDTATATITVTAAGTSPVAAFVPSSSNVVVGQVVNFTNDTVGTEPIGYAWTFGDGGASTLANPTHSYAAGGVYTVILTATNDYGEDTATSTISVVEVEHRIYLPLVLKNS